MIKTFVNLNDGRKNVEAYYLDKEDRDNFFALWRKITHNEVVIERLESDVSLLLKSVDYDHIRPYVKYQLWEYLKERYPLDKSFRLFTVYKNFPHKRFTYEILLEFAKEGKLEMRGSGWYRRLSND